MKISAQSQQALQQFDTNGDGVSLKELNDNLGQNGLDEQEAAELGIAPEDIAKLNQSISTALSSNMEPAEIVFERTAPPNPTPALRGNTLVSESLNAFENTQDRNEIKQNLEQFSEDIQNLSEQELNELRDTITEKLTQTNDPRKREFLMLLYSIAVSAEIDKVPENKRPTFSVLPANNVGIAFKEFRRNGSQAGETALKEYEARLNEEWKSSADLNYVKHFISEILSGKNTSFEPLSQADRDYLLRLYTVADQAYEKKLAEETVKRQQTDQELRDMGFDPEEFFS